MWQSFSHLSGFLHDFVMAKLANFSSIRVRVVRQRYQDSRYGKNICVGSTKYMYYNRPHCFNYKQENNIEIGRRAVF